MPGIWAKVSRRLKRHRFLVSWIQFIKFGIRFSPSPNKITSKNGANGSGLAVRTGPPPKTIGSLSVRSSLQIGILCFSKRFNNTGPSSSQLSDNPNSSVFLWGVSPRSVNNLLTSTSFLLASVAQITW